MDKCVCGYESGYDWENKKDIGDEKFIVSDSQIVYDRDDYNPKRIKYILICPKCGTLKIDI